MSCATFSLTNFMRFCCCPSQWPIFGENLRKAEIGATLIKVPTITLAPDKRLGAMAPIEIAIISTAPCIAITGSYVITSEYMPHQGRRQEKYEITVKLSVEPTKADTRVKSRNVITYKGQTFTSVPSLSGIISDSFSSDGDPVPLGAEPEESKPVRPKLSAEELTKQLNELAAEDK